MPLTVKSILRDVEQTKARPSLEIGDQTVAKGKAPQPFSLAIEPRHVPPVGLAIAVAIGAEIRGPAVAMGLKRQANLTTN